MKRILLTWNRTSLLKRIAIGVVIGVIIFQIISYGLIYIGVSPDLQYVVKGLIIIVAVVLDNQKSLRKAA